jgi:hypothetical protein
MTEAILHIGHSKTGSSYLQSVLSLNVDRLAARGIDYPDHPSFGGAGQGRISSGNGNLLFETDVVFTHGRKTLLSNELLFEKLAQGDNLQIKVLDRVDQLRVVLYTRDLLEALVSKWGQAVKRGGETRSLDDWLQATRVSEHSGVLWWLGAAKRHGFELALHNYSRRRDRLLSHFLSILLQGDSDTSGFRLPPENRINRSMTQGEYATLRVLNTVSKQLGHKASDELVNGLPGLMSDRPGMTAETYDLVVRTYAPVIAEINGYLGPEDRLKIGDATEFVRRAGEEEILSDGQIGILAGVISRALLSRQEADSITNLVRDVALKIEGRRGVTLSDALALMKVAQRLRPQGPTINRKVAEWEERLSPLADRG